MTEQTEMEYENSGWSLLADDERFPFQAKAVKYWDKPTDKNDKARAEIFYKSHNKEYYGIYSGGYYIDLTKATDVFSAIKIADAWIQDNRKNENYKSHKDLLAERGIFP